MNLVDFSLVLKNVGKLLVVINDPRDTKIIEQVLSMIEKAKQNTFDDEIRAMIPSLFKAITSVYHVEPETLIKFYDNVKGFISDEI
jgi:hypothetical protein